MKILVIAATRSEVEPAIPFLEKHHINVLITGVGMVATAYAIGNKLANNTYDLLLNVGIAGSFSNEIPLGDVVHVTADQLIELGAEDGDQFLTIEDLGLGHSKYTSKAFSATDICAKLTKVTGITVNTVHGNNISIEKIDKQLAPYTIESMEGAAVFHAANEANIPVLQIRAISNYVEPRDTSKWNIPLAITNLNEWIEKNIFIIQKH